MPSNSRSTRRILFHEYYYLYNTLWSTLSLCTFSDMVNSGNSGFWFRISEFKLEIWVLYISRTRKLRVSPPLGTWKWWKPKVPYSHGQIQYRSRIENWRILWVTSPGDSTALSQCSYIWPAELRNHHSQTCILEMLHTVRYIVICIPFIYLYGNPSNPT